ncbi:DUF3453 domain-containing protein/Symplekin_C domain-containing protein [Cephalotus follicularis]|uniref:DUF3453 domain-containing protein/Symplekin_C domain-containing protein n=1 Tax=Cephalotus follicularis TaxID=3775 RepID=A0A1Q3AQP6_CEPFO|nr:DUF3453 domain-containing protein/Symplekin_C domain-containing protein [Cephalotus follicularis]
MAYRDQALSLLAAASNHADLAVKLSSLKQVKHILSSVGPSFAAELFPYLLDLHSSPECLVRKSLIEFIGEIGLRALEHSTIFMPVLLAYLRDSDPTVAKQTIICGTHFFRSVLEEMALQLQQRGKIERWIEELWTWMLKFKDIVFTIALEPGLVGTKLLVLKFLETHILLFTTDTNDSEKYVNEGSRSFNISWLVDVHPAAAPAMLMSETNTALGILLDLLQTFSSLPGTLAITVINCLAAIARKRPLHYSSILSALLDFNPNFDTLKGHAASIQYSLRTAFLGFLRCTHPTVLESREKLLRALRAMNAGDAADQVIRQVDKMIKNTERASRETRLSRDDQLPSQLPVSGDLLKKRGMPQDIEDPADSLEMAPKRARYGLNSHLSLPVETNDFGHDSVYVNGVSHGVSNLDGYLTSGTPVEQMIALIGALLAEGERGAESLELLIAKIHPDLLADIVITNMKHLPMAPPPLTKLGNLPVTRQISSASIPAQVVAPSAPANFTESPILSAPVLSSSAAAVNSLLSEPPTANNFPADSKRDPRRDPRLLDPRRIAVPGVQSIATLEDTSAIQSDFDSSISLSKPLLLPVVTSESLPEPLLSNTISDDKTLESPSVSGIDQPNPKEEVLARAEEIVPIPELHAFSDHAPSPIHTIDDDSVAIKLFDAEVTPGTDTSSVLEYDLHSPAVSGTDACEESRQELPVLPAYVELSEEQQRNVRKLAVEQIIEPYKHLQETYCSQTHIPILARLVAQIDAADDIVAMLQKHIFTAYQQQKGHELVLHVLYHLHFLMISDSVEASSYAAVVYEKFLVAVAKSLLDNFPTSDKSFSKLLGDVPFLPESALKLLDDLCYSDVVDSHGREVRDGERVTQGLGAVWSLILGRPNNRQACLDIVLKCAVHSQDDIRGKAIRLVANKLYQLGYIAENIEQFATKSLLSAVDQQTPDIEVSQTGANEQRAEGEVATQETSISGSQVSEHGISENDSVRGAQPLGNCVPSLSFPEAQRRISLFFALCTKKPSLLQLIFDIYGQAPRIVKQAFHRHIPILIRALGSSYTALLRIISNPPQGSENLLTLVLQILTQETTPSPELIATVKHLYETKLKDATILIPMLSSLSKNEVLPIFPRLVDLPLEKFQMALAHILQGSAHTGPALTPAEVLVSIHDIIPEKDGLALKKIMDACSACFEQRTVFTQQVLAKALSQMVDQTPLPLLFMRTVIQAIDAFPTLVDFVMEILSKLVSKQVWRMPKLWVGFLKCVYQTQPHSFRVLLQLPAPQLEIALNKYANLRGPLAAYVSQPSSKMSLPGSALAVLGLSTESHLQQHVSSLHSSDTSSSVRGATPT